MATLTVGAGKQYQTIAAAAQAARNGDTVAVSAGTYVNDFAAITSKISLIAMGGQVTLLATRAPPSGQGLLTVSADATIDGFIVSGAASADGSGAGLLYKGGALTVRNSLFTGNQNGLLALADPAGTILIQSSEFARNGANDGFSHNISVGAVKSLTIQDSYIHDAIGGSEIKSRAQATAITDSRIADNGSAATIGIDLPSGGAVTIQNNVIEKGAQALNPAVIRLGAGAAGSLKASGNTIVSDFAGAALLQNQSSLIANISGNRLYGFTGGGSIATGPAALSGNTVLSSRPDVSTAAIITPAMALPVEYGRAGAVVANGTTLTVGPNGAYASLAAALAAARDGDTIRVAAGTYAGPSLVISRKLIIEGEGGLARFIPTETAFDGPGQFVVLADATFRNVEIAGAYAPAGVAAAIHVQAGAVTIVNSFIHDNQAGVVASRNAGASIGIYDTEIARNGTPDGRGGNIDVAEIGTLTVRNAYVHDGLVSAEIRSRADNTAIDGTRISQLAGNGGAGIELPNGGRVAITGGAIEKGAYSQPGALIQVGGGQVSAGSAASVSGTTLINDRPGPAAPFVVAGPGAGTLTVSGAVFAGNTDGALVKNGVNTNPVRKGGVSIGGGAPWGQGGAPMPPPATVPTPALPEPGREVLVLRISGDAYQGNAKFTVTLDGKQIGDTLQTTARHGAGETQAFTIAGTFAPGPHSIAVQFVNDLEGAGGGQDRNLYVDGLSFNGQELGQAKALFANGTALLSTGAVSQLTPISVNLSQDAWKGDAQAFIAIDGRVTGGVLGVTASHAAGETQAMQFLLDLAPGPHTAAVTFLNPAGDADAQRRLYVESIEVAGHRYDSAATALTDKGTSVFAFSVAPPLADNAVFLTAGTPQPLAWLLPGG